jgi:DNA-binding MarR family transcriptional regulator
MVFVKETTGSPSASAVSGVAVKDEPRWLTAKEQSVWRAYLDVTRLLNDRLHRQLVDDSGLSLAEYDILVHLSEAQGLSLRMSQLADHVVHSRSRLTHTISRLEQRGLVRRDPCPDDGRGVLCVLTPAGFSNLAGAAPGHVDAVRQGVFDPLSPQQVTELGEALEAIRSGLRDA